MAQSQPLTDEDRAGWLEELSTAGIEKLTSNSLVVVACSALKKKYRDVFRTAVNKHNEECWVLPSVTGASQDIKVSYQIHLLTQQSPQKLGNSDDSLVELLLPSHGPR